MVENTQENFELIDEAKEIDNDYWLFHIKDYPSRLTTRLLTLLKGAPQGKAGYCIVHTKDLDKSEVIFAGSLVKSYSKLKNQKKVKIIYIQIKYINKTKTIDEVLLNQKQNVITILNINLKIYF